MSYSDDYLFICVSTGIAGEAIWKKTPYFPQKLKKINK